MITQDFPNSSIIAYTLNLTIKQVEAVLNLLKEGGTIPFIARYRKDQTGALDEIAIQQIQDLSISLKEFDERKAFIEKTIAAQGKLTEELQAKLNNAKDLNELEDIYLPFKPKRKTKAQAAREKGLEPLAQFIMNQSNESPYFEAEKYISEEVADTETALAGAKDIIAEIISEHDEVRSSLRNTFEKQGIITSKILSGKDEDGKKFKDYFDFSEAINKIPSHRILAILRGFMEGFLKISISIEEETALDLIQKKYIQAQNENSQILNQAIKESYKRLLQPSLESEFRMQLKNKGDEEAINVFAENLKQLLLSAPLGNKQLLAIDPGFRTGCKTVVINKNGELIYNTVIYVEQSNHKTNEATETIKNLVSKYQIEAFAIGDGTAGRETELFVRNLQLNLPIYMVNEDGASIYSASEIAREEFPDYDLTVRGAVSIGRRLMDPLAELVKIDPKSIGVGQYQHDVNQTRLKDKLDQTVVSCVNAVGVNLNTAGKHLLSYVSGIGNTIAENIVKYRSENGPFTERKELLKVPRLGNKAYEQAAGFLRINNGNNPLDASGVHPEAYNIVTQMAKNANVPIANLIGNKLVLDQINKTQYVTEGIGLHTLEDILKELKKPGLDPRAEIEQFTFANIYSIEDTQTGMIVPGIVTNITKFGAFVDIGVHQDGLVHVSEITNRYITDPAEALKLNDKVMVKVLDVDRQRKRISLSIKQAQPNYTEQSRNNKPLNKAPNGTKSDGIQGGNNLQNALDQLRKKFDR